MERRNHLHLTQSNDHELRPTMTWKFYYMIMEYYSGKDYTDLRIRLAVFLLCVTRAQISEILILRMSCFKTLHEQFIIEIGKQILFIQNKKVREIIEERKSDISYLSTIKTENDFIFTSKFNLHAKAL